MQLMRPAEDVLGVLKMLLTVGAQTRITAVEIPSYTVNKRIAECEAARATAAAPLAGRQPAAPPAGPARQAAPAELKGGAVCREFTRGQCLRGNACRFHHG